MASQHESRTTRYFPNLRRKPVFQEEFQERTPERQSMYEFTEQQSAQRGSARNHRVQGQDLRSQSKQYQPVESQPIQRSVQQQPVQRSMTQKQPAQKPTQHRSIQKQPVRQQEPQIVTRQATSQKLEDLLDPNQLKTMHELEEEEKAPKQAQSLSQDIWDWMLGKSNVEKEPDVPVPVITINGKPVV